MQTEALFSQPNFHVGGAMAGRDSAQKMRVLSDEEMAQVSGGNLLGGIVGGVLAGVGYGINYAYTGSGSLSQALTVTAAGALAGALSPVTAIAAVWGFNVTVVAATISGIQGMPAAPTGGGGQSCTAADGYSIFIVDDIESILSESMVT